MGLAKDEDKRTMQIFSPRKIVTVTINVAYLVSTDEMKAFRVGQSCTYYINSDSTAATMAAGMAVGVAPNVTSVTFNTTMNIEIM